MVVPVCGFCFFNVGLLHLWIFFFQVWVCCVCGVFFFCFNVGLFRSNRCGFVAFVGFFSFGVGLFCSGGCFFLDGGGWWWLVVGVAVGLLG